MNHKKDIKFVIYQVLYIFVICVFAIKGADLNLTKVVAKDKSIPPETRDSLIGVIDSLIALGIIPEITNNPVIDDGITSITEQGTGTTPVNPPLPPPEKVDTESEDPDNDEEEPIPVIQKVKLVQFRENTLRNLNNVDMSLKFDDGTTLIVPPKSSKTFVIKGQNSVTITAGNQTEVISIDKNDNPKINFKKIAGTKKVSELQRIIGFRVEILDDYPDQLEVSISGSVKYVQVAPMIYDVTLNYFTSRSSFEKFTENRDSPYRINFSVTVTDKVSGKPITQIGTFEFEDW